MSFNGDAVALLVAEDLRVLIDSLGYNDAGFCSPLEETPGKETSTRFVELGGVRLGQVSRWPEYPDGSAAGVRAAGHSIKESSRSGPERSAKCLAAKEVVPFISLGKVRDTGETYSAHVPW
jgi:hypothetical protein